jgi:hypothetical protein
MKNMIKLIPKILLNRNLHKLILLLLIHLTIIYLINLDSVESNLSDFPFLIILLFVNFIYLYILTFKILYEITSINQFESDITFPNFFFKLTIYQFFIGIIFIILFYSLFDLGEKFSSEQKLNQIPDRVSFKIYLFKEFFYIIDLIGFVILTGTRSFANLYIKLKVLLSTKPVYVLILLQICFWISNVFFLYQYNYSISFLIFFKIIVVIGLAFPFFLTILEFQRKFFLEN